MSAAGSAVKRILASFSVAVAVAGCATPPPPRPPATTVILMPDEDGHVGSVSVTTAAGTQRIDEAFAASTVSAAGAAPSVAAALDRDTVTAGYDRLLKAQPPKPVSFVLYFHLDRTTLTDDSKALIPDVIAAIRARKPTEIAIFGHTDAIGTEQHNMKLSAERARAIEALLRKDDPTLDHIDVQFFGDRLPLIPSGSRAEPRNRRAEIQIL